jgi:hypothetical protein
MRGYWYLDSEYDKAMDLLAKQYAAVRHNYVECSKKHSKNSGKHQQIYGIAFAASYRL